MTTIKIQQYNGTAMGYSNQALFIYHDDRLNSIICLTKKGHLTSKNSLSCVVNAHKTWIAAGKPATFECKV